MRVTIIVKGEHLNDVTVEANDYSMTLDGQGAEVRLAQLISDVVRQTLDAYGLNDSSPSP